MKHALLKTTHALEVVSLGLMMGGMLTLGAFVAPMVFRSFPVDQAGAVMTVIFRRFDAVLLVCLAGVALGEVVRFLTKADKGSKLLARLRRVSVLGLMAVTLYGSLMVHPQIEAFQKAGVRRGVGVEGQAFECLHKTSESLYKTDFVLSTVTLILLALI